MLQIFLFIYLFYFSLNLFVLSFAWVFTFSIRIHNNKNQHSHVEKSFQPCFHADRHIWFDFIFLLACHIIHLLENWEINRWLWRCITNGSKQNKSNTYIYIYICSKIVCFVRRQLNFSSHFWKACIAFVLLITRICTIRLVFIAKLKSKRQKPDANKNTSKWVNGMEKNWCSTFHSNMNLWLEILQRLIDDSIYIIHLEIFAFLQT